jgi:hypothetical protein
MKNVLDTSCRENQNIFHVQKLFFFYFLPFMSSVKICSRLLLKCVGTHAETRFCLSVKRTCPFKSAGASVQSITGNHGVRISGSNAGYTKFRGSEGYWLPTSFATFPFPSPPVRHRVPSLFNSILQTDRPQMTI